jgi:hypothetical protein
MGTTQYPGLKRSENMIRRRDPKPFRRPVRLWRGLSDAEWCQITRLKHLPVKVRKEIDIAIHVYRRERKLEQTRKPSWVIRRELEVQLKAALKLHDWFESAKWDPHLNLALSQLPGDNFGAVIRSDRRAGRNRANIAQAAQLTVINTIEQARNRIQRSKTGPRVDALSDLVFALFSFHLRFTGRGFSRSRKHEDSQNLVRFVCGLADASIGRGSIDAAMKEIIKKCGRLRWKRGNLWWPN